MNSTLRNENRNFTGLSLPPLPTYLNSNSFNTSNSLAVSEQETLNERLFTTEEILGLKNVIPNGLSVSGASAVCNSMGKGRMHRYEWGKDNDSGTAATRKSPW